MSKKTKKQSIDESLFLGWGAKLSHNEAQLIYDIIKRQMDDFIGEQLVSEGSGYIHGVLDKEEDIRFPFKWSNLHNLITGASGSGKTRFMELVMTQLIMRGECCIYLDPKGDKDIRKVAKNVCDLIGEPERYLMWHPAYPKETIRLNPLKNFSRSSELAARVTALIPEDGDTFYRDIANTVLQYIIDGMHLIGEQVTLTAIRYYYEHFGLLIEKTVIAWCEANRIEWKEKLYSKLEASTNEEIRALLCVDYYRTKVASKYRNSTIDSMASMYVEKRRTLEQSTANLLANLSKVTNGPLAEMLSPTDLDDQRAAFDMKSIIADNKVLVIGTDSLSDRIVSSAIGKMILADAAAVASDRYNYGDEDDKVINLFVDEASEMLCEPLIQMINKARGAKFRLWIATQTVSDFEAELGSKAKSDQIIASTNNFISFRCSDVPTQDRVLSQVPPTKVRYVMKTQGFDGSGGSLDANIGERLMEDEADMLPKQLMGQLPNLEYVASFVGGQLYKGRIPIFGTEKAA
ncbi:conjugative transfer system coupling protein TraD [Vibrio coralliilyticus]|uniref:Conjugative transfer system coupling protein TraD n=1 Tax=Vibrio coralliilyticus TaxID=190893 RepID=A0AAP6ZNF8_9VIBR|nr:conjugative transfer system coupling protein TraD [Vibrio coralliilyticus]NOJ25276.1 conjugative transfer system coupling protein TraD [Vibrio coralliilyticus]